MTILHRRAPTRGIERRVAGAFAAGAIALALVVASASPAFAHAELVTSSPSPGSGLPQAPGAVVLKFTEPLNRRLSHLEVNDRAGRDVAVGPTVAVTGDANAMRRELGLLQPGAYTVEWTTVSSVDGHTLKGSYQFGIGDAAIGNEQVASNPVDSEGWLGLVGSFVAFVGLALWAGAAFLDPVARRAGLGASRLRRLELLGPPVALLGTAMAVVSSAIVARGSPFVLGGVLFASRSGHWHLVTLIAAGVGTLLGLIGLSTRWRFLTGAVALAAVVGVAASGHAGNTTDPTLATASLSVHLLAVGVWVFALVCSVLASEGLRRALGAFAPYAIGAAAVVLLTGTVNAVFQLNQVGELFTTSYGTVIVLKIIALITMAAIGFTHNRWRRSAARDLGSLRDLVVGELGAAAVAIVLAVVLVAYPNPPREDAIADELAETNPVSRVASQPAISVASAAGPFIVGLTVSPPKPGPVDVQVQVIGVEAGDAFRNGVAHATAAGTADERASVDIPLHECGIGCFAGHGAIPSAGTWQLTTDFVTNRGAVETTNTVPLPAHDGSTLVHDAIQAMERLTSAQLHEELRATQNAPPTVADYVFAAPDRFSFSIVGGGQRVTIGTDQYNRDSPTARWTKEPSTPGGLDAGYRWPKGYYRDFWQYANAARIIGTDTVDGVPTQIVAFVRPDLPAWFRLWIAPDGLVHRMEMRAEGHLMDHHYFDFNQPVMIRAPV
jgi:methionine-rich copper-binding protein CopC/putative copper export protein